MDLSNWEVYYTVNDDGIWVTDGTRHILIGHCITVQEIIDRIELNAIERERFGD